MPLLTIAFSPLKEATGHCRFFLRVPRSRGMLLDSRGCGLNLPEDNHPDYEAYDRGKVYLDAETDDLKVKTYRAGQAFLDDRQGGNEPRRQRPQRRTQNGSHQHEGEQISEVVLFERHRASWELLYIHFHGGFLSRDF